MNAVHQELNCMGAICYWAATISFSQTSHSDYEETYCLHHSRAACAEQTRNLLPSRMNDIGDNLVVRSETLTGI